MPGRKERNYGRGSLPEREEGYYCKRALPKRGTRAILSRMLVRGGEEGAHWKGGLSEKGKGIV